MNIIDNVPEDSIAWMKAVMAGSMSSFTRKKLINFLHGKSPYFKFQQDDTYQESLRFKDSRREQVQKNYAIMRLLAVSNLLNGYITAYESENSGEYIREVTPKIDSQVGSQGACLLPFHSDMGYLRFPHEQKHPNPSRGPDYLVLSCVRNSEKVGTHIIDIETIKNVMGEKFEGLKQGWYSFQSPESVKPAKKYKGKPIIFTDKKGSELIRWERCLPSNHGGSGSFSSLFLLLENLDLGEEVIMKPGETLVLNNRRCLHGRKHIEVSKDIKKPRLLYRIYVNSLPAPSGASGKRHLFYRQEGKRHLFYRQEG